MQKLTKFKVIFDLFTVCVYFIQQQNGKLYYIYLMIISEIQSEIGHCSCDHAKFKAPADFSHHAILCMTLSLSYIKFADFYANKLSFYKNSAKANWPGFFQVSNKLYPYYRTCKKDVISIREILANLSVLSVSPNTFYRPSKKSKSALAMGTYAETRNVSMGHRCPRYCQIRINRELSLTKGNNS